MRGERQRWNLQTVGDLPGRQARWPLLHQQTGLPGKNGSRRNGFFRFHIFLIIEIPNEGKLEVPPSRQPHKVFIEVQKLTHAFTLP